MPSSSSARNTSVNYPIVRARKDDKEVIAVYADHSVRIEADAPGTVHLVNGSPKSELLVQLMEEGKRNVRVFDAQGILVREHTLTAPALLALDIPESGLATFQKLND